MTDIAIGTIASAPPAHLRYRFRYRFGGWIRDLWRSRELVFTLAERDLRARYKQAILGFAWALISPVALMVVFSLFFQRVARIDTGNVPYQLFSYVGLLPWTFFSSSVSSGGQSLIINKHLLNKVYCPREVFPIASMGTSAVDTCFALIALGLLFLIHSFAPHATAIWVPLIVVILLAFTTGVTLIVSGIMVYLRDVRHGLPLLLQLGLFATPVAYGIDAVPRSVRGVYAALNPLAGVIESLRNTILLGKPPAWKLLVPGTITSVSLLLIGYAIFKRMEAGFADVA